MNLVKPNPSDFIHRTPIINIYLFLAILISYIKYHDLFILIKLKNLITNMIQKVKHGQKTAILEIKKNTHAFITFALMAGGVHSYCCAYS